MIDMHSHIIFGVDDGSPSMKESIRMVLEAERLGIRAIIATPHFHGDIYKSEKADHHLKELAARTAGCGVELHSGYEVLITPFLPEMTQNMPNLMLAHSRYLLFELPFDLIPVYSQDVVYKLHLQNIIPVLAHPERNRNFVKSFNAFIGFIEQGCLIQVDAASVIGIYGIEVKNFVKKLIKMNLVHFVASDAHTAEDYMQWYLEAYRKVSRWGGVEYADRVFHTNPGKVLGNSPDIE